MCDALRQSEDNHLEQVKVETVLLYEKNCFKKNHACFVVSALAIFQSAVLHRI